jgi:hypothetical protein
MAIDIPSQQRKTPACNQQTPCQPVPYTLQTVSRFPASNMVLAAHSDASVNPTRSRAGGHIFLSEDDPIPATMAHIALHITVMKHVCPSAGEAVTGAFFIVAQEMVPRNMLTEMGWPQTTLTYTNGQLHRSMVTSTTQSSLSNASNPQK